MLLQIQENETSFRVIFWAIKFQTFIILTILLYVMTLIKHLYLPCHVYVNFKLHYGIFTKIVFFLQA